MPDFDPYHRWLGIPPDERPISKYRLLALADFEGDPEVINAAAEGRTVFLRTMQAGQHANLVAQLLNEVSLARVTLLDPEKKSAYDAQLRKEQEQEKVISESAPKVLTGQAITPPVASMVPMGQAITPIGSLPTPSPELPSGSVSRATWSRRRPMWKRPEVIGLSLAGVVLLAALFFVLRDSEDLYVVEKPVTLDKAVVENVMPEPSSQPLPKPASTSPPRVQPLPNPAPTPPPPSQPSPSPAPTSQPAVQLKPNTEITATPSGNNVVPIVFLDDLKESSSRLREGYVIGRFGESGYIDSISRKHLTKEGVPVEHAISLHAAKPDMPNAYVEWELPNDFKVFTGRVGFHSGYNFTNFESGPTYFSIYGDDQLLWKSEPCLDTNAREVFAIDVTGVRKLRLEVSYSGSSEIGRTAIWLSPALSTEQLDLPVENIVETTVLSAFREFASGYEDLFARCLKEVSPGDVLRYGKTSKLTVTVKAIDNDEIAVGPKGREKLYPLDSLSIDWQIAIIDAKATEKDRLVLAAFLILNDENYTDEALALWKANAKAASVSPSLIDDFLAEEEPVETFQDNLIAYYPFNGNPKDESKFTIDHSMKAVGTTLTADRFGNVNSAAMFDGIDDYLEQSRGEMMPQGTGDFTIALWCKAVRIDRTARILFSNQTLDSLQLAIMDSRGSLALLFGGKGKDIISTPYLGWEYNKWYHVSVTRHGGRFRIFRDGELLAFGGSEIDLNASAPNQRLSFGSRPSQYSNGKRDHPWHGAIDDIRVYDISLPQADIKAIYEQERRDSQPTKGTE